MCSDRNAGKKPVSHTWRFIVPPKIPFSYQGNQITGISEAFFFSLAMESFDDKEEHSPFVREYVEILVPFVTVFG